MAERREPTLPEALRRKMSWRLSGRTFSALKPQFLFLFLGIIVQSLAGYVADTLFGLSVS